MGAARLARVAGWLIGAWLLGGPSSGHAQGCRPAVLLEGPAELTAPIGRALGDRVVREPRGGACSEVRAQVERVGGRVAVTLVEVASPRSRRDFASEALAAAFIESWTRSDVSGPLLAGSPAITPPSAPPVVAAPVAATRPRLLIAAAGTVAVASDRSLWAGALLGVCARVGALCVGGDLLLRERVAPSGPGPIAPLPTNPPTPETLGLQRRLDAAALLCLRWLAPTRYVEFLTSVGLGVGLWSNQLVSTEPNAPIAPRDQAGGRARLELGGAVSLGRGLRLGLSASADFAFGGTGTMNAVRSQPGVMGMTPAPPVVGVPALSAPWGVFGLNLGLSWRGLPS